MSIRLIRVHAPRQIDEPRGARWAGMVVGLVVAIGDAFNRGLRRSDTDQSPPGDKDLLALAARVEREMPVLAVELRAIAGHQARAI